MARPGILLAYDGDGNRVSETVGGSTTKFLVDDHNSTGLPQVLDELVNGAVTRTYAYGLQRISENQLINGTWTPSFYGYDGHGNARFLTNSAGAITDTYTYDAFGMAIRNTGTTSNTFLYSGERYDSSIGLYDLRDRYYYQATGRFETLDPIDGDIQNPSTLHKYTYTANNPVNFVDPTGDEALLEFAALQLFVLKQTYATAYPLGQCYSQAFSSSAVVLGAVVNGSASNVAVPGQFIAYNLGVCYLKAVRNGLLRPNPLPLVLPPWLRRLLPPGLLPNPLPPWYPIPLPQPKPIGIGG